MKPKTPIRKHLLKTTDPSTLKYKTSWFKYFLIAIVILVVVTHFIFLTFKTSTIKTHHIHSYEEIRKDVLQEKVHKTIENVNEYISIDETNLGTSHSLKEALKNTVNQVPHSSQLNLALEFAPSSGRVNLPSFAVNETEYVFGSIIEREADSYNLYLTVFFLCHYQLSFDTSKRKFHPLSHDVWNKAIHNFHIIEYLPNGQRKSSPIFYCRIQISQYSPAYTVKGIFVPNKLSEDGNSNRMLDILRCPLDHPNSAYDKFGHSDEDIFVDIIRGDKIIISYSIPWKHRKTGFLLSNPTSVSGASSTLDEWKGYTKRLVLGFSKLEKVHICVLGTKRLVAKAVLPLYLEFLSHHLLLGVSHIYLPLSLAWTSPKMKNALKIFSSYIQEGVLSISSMAGDELDLVQSTSGMAWSKLEMKVIQSNMCLYQAKGVAEYVMMLDIDEFFIPKEPHNSILKVIESVESQGEELIHPLLQRKKDHPNYSPKELFSLWKPAPGWADRAAHPFCYLSIQSIELYNKPGKSKQIDPEHPWIGERFNYDNMNEHTEKARLRSYTKIIVPTRYIYQSGVVVPGACALPLQYTSLSQKIPTNLDLHQSGPYSAIITDALNPPRINYNSQLLKMYHSPYDIVTSSTRKLINFDTEGFIYHIRLFLEEGKNQYINRTNSNEYTSRFFPYVMIDLHSRHLDILMMVDDDTSSDSVIKTHTDVDVTQLWKPLTKLETKSIFTKVNEHRCKESVIPNLDRLMNRTSNNVMQLPALTLDQSDYVLGGMIERVSDSFDLWLTTFMLGQFIICPQQGGSQETALKISKQVYKLWVNALNNMDKVKDHLYSSGERLQPPSMSCRVTPAKGYDSYIVRGWFVPNRLQTDPNSNRRTDIFRCFLQDGKTLYMNLANTDAIMTVEILKDGLPIMKYEIPWKTRMTGFMLEPVPQIATRFDPWKGFDKTQPGVWTHDDFYMCVPGIELAPSQKSMSQLLEFIQHHILRGTSHIFLGVVLGENSPHMRLFLKVLKSYIDDGFVSVVPTTLDGIDGVYSTHGISWGRDNIKNIYVNMCTYIAKGVADYVGVWDNDEFLIPRGDNKNIQDIIDKVDVKYPIASSFSLGDTIDEIKENWTIAPGVADHEGHPFCAFTFQSAVKKSPLDSSVDPENPWIGVRYNHPAEPFNEKRPGMGFKKSVRPTRRIFMAGLHVVGACRLEPEWTPCQANETLNGFCFGVGDQHGKKDNYRKRDGMDFHINHRFDERLTDKDLKFVDHINEGVIYHIQINRPWLKVNFQKVNKNETSEYTAKYFPEVLQHFHQRNLVLPMTLPFKINKTNYLYQIPNPWIKVSSDVWNKSILNKTTSILLNNGFDYSLPKWSIDRSQLLLGSVIERGHNTQASTDFFVNTFLLTHHRLEKSYLQSIHETESNSWKLYYESQKAYNSRDKKFSCSIKNSKSDQSYKIEAEFISSHLLSEKDNVMESPVDIVRCKLSGIQSVTSLLNENLHISLYAGSIEISSFIVPWRTRVNSLLLEATNTSSTLDAWTGFFDKNEKQIKQVYTILKSTDMAPSKLTISYYIENIQHMFNLGVQHIFISVQFDRGSIHMKRILDTFRSYIKEGLVTVTSASFGGLQLYPNFAGAVWDKSVFDTIQIIMRLYFLKGMSTYTTLSEINQFFIPQNEDNSILATIIQTKLTFPSICLIGFENKKVLNQKDLPIESSWIGEKFTYGAEENLNPESDYVSVVIMDNFKLLLFSNMSLIYNCLGMTPNMENNKNIIHSELAYYYQFKEDEYIAANSNAFIHDNIYSKHYSEKVKNELSKRNLDLLIDLDHTSTIECGGTNDWIDYHTYFQARNHLNILTLNKLI